MAASDITPFTLGVEEEYLLVDRHTLALRPRGERRSRSGFLVEATQPPPAAA